MTNRGVRQQTTVGGALRLTAYTACGAALAVVELSPSVDAAEWIANLDRLLDEQDPTLRLVPDARL